MHDEGIYKLSPEDLDNPIVAAIQQCHDGLFYPAECMRFFMLATEADRHQFLEIARRWRDKIDEAIRKANAE